jgi:lysyl-tRNA synthetase class I
METYLYYPGLQKLAQTMSGTEKIHVGIRPYELHAGNILSIAVYPYLLCEAVAARGITPRFTLFVSINDWEQETLVGPDIYRYIFDTKPEHTTIKYATTPEGADAVSHWQPKIEREVLQIKKDFPEVTIRFIRNSELRDEPPMRHVIEHTIKNRKQHKELLLQVSGQQTMGHDTYFGNALCPKCLHANTASTITPAGLLQVQCQSCSYQGKDAYSAYDFWLYHKQLFTARLAILQFDLAISGGDHYKEGDAESRYALYELIMGRPASRIKMLFAPIMIAENGAKMSKSRKNNIYAPFDAVLKMAQCVDDQEIHFGSTGIITAHKTATVGILSY